MKGVSDKDAQKNKKITGKKTDFKKPLQVLADLPTGNAVKDPNAILRNALPIKQVELQEIQHKLEETSDLVRGGRWPALTKTVTKCQSLLKKYQNKKIIKLRIHPKKEKSSFNHTK